MSYQTEKDRFNQIGQAFKRNDIGLVKELAAQARQIFINKGMVQAQPVFAWIEKEWLDKALAENVLVLKDGQYIPVVDVKIVEKVVEYRGREAIRTEKFEVLDNSRFNNFLLAYEEFKRNKR